jgi:hypothetical protein
MDQTSPKMLTSWSDGGTSKTRTSSFSSERVFGFTGLTLSDLRKSMFESTIEEIMWDKWGSPSIPLGRGDLHIIHPELCD